MENSLPTPPQLLAALQARSDQLGFDMASDAKTGAWLRTLAASKPGGRLLEMGTGTGLGTCWLLDGMDASARLVSVDNDPRVQAVAAQYLADDPRLRLVCQDGSEYLQSLQGENFDLIFADAWPGKFEHLDRTLNLLAPGGFYLVDDLLPQPNWPAGHAPKVPRLLDVLAKKPELVLTILDWSSGLAMAARRPD